MKGVSDPVCCSQSRGNKAKNEGDFKTAANAKQILCKSTVAEVICCTSATILRNLDLILRLRLCSRIKRNMRYKSNGLTHSTY